MKYKCRLRSKKEKKRKENKQEEAPVTPSISFFLKKKLYIIHFKSIFT